MHSKSNKLLAITKRVSYITHMGNIDLRDIVKKWVKKSGKTVCIKALVNEDIPASTALKLCSGNYPYDPKSLLAGAIRRAMDKNGFSVGAEKAS